MRDLPEVQWLRRRAAGAGDIGLTPGWCTNIIPCGATKGVEGGNPLQGLEWAGLRSAPGTFCVWLLSPDIVSSGVTCVAVLVPHSSSHPSNSPTVWTSLCLSATHPWTLRCPAFWSSELCCCEHVAYVCLVVVSLTLGGHPQKECEQGTDPIGCHFRRTDLVAMWSVG